MNTHSVDTWDARGVRLVPLAGNGGGGAEVLSEILTLPEHLSTHVGPGTTGAFTDNWGPLQASGDGSLGPLSKSAHNHEYILEYIPCGLCYALSRGNPCCGKLLQRTF